MSLHPQTFTAFLALASFLFTTAGAQDMSETGTQMVQPRRLIDMHTAGVLPKANFDLETRVYPSRHDDVDGAGVTFCISVGITDRFMFGGGYGADGLVGHGTVRGNPWPGLLLKYRLVEESYHFPAIALGFDWQGYGGVQGYENEGDTYRGYVYKSQGFFASLSKNYLFFSKVQFGIHASVNYSIENLHNVTWPNCFVGADLGLNEELAVALEYNVALNELDPDKDGYINPLQGFLNAGIRWAIFPSFYIEFNAKDILRNKLYIHTDPVMETEALGWSRELKLVYLTGF